MASLEKMNKKGAPNGASLGAKEEEDLSMMVTAGADLLAQGGLDVIRKALQASQDPAQVVGQVLAQILTALAEQSQTLDVNPKVFLAKGGWLEKMLDYIERKLKLPQEFSDQVWTQVVEMIKAEAMAGGQQQPQQGGPPTNVMGGPQQQAPNMGGGMV